MVLKNLEKRIGSVKVKDLPPSVRDKIAHFKLAKKNLNAIQRSLGESFDAGFALAYPRSEESKYRDIAIGKAKRELTGAAEGIRQAISNRNYPANFDRFIGTPIVRGATHVHLGAFGRTLHFVKLPAKHRAKLYEPIAGNVRIPIHE